MRRSSLIFIIACLLIIVACATAPIYLFEGMTITEPSETSIDTREAVTSIAVKEGVGYIIIDTDSTLTSPRIKSNAGVPDVTYDPELSALTINGTKTGSDADTDDTGIIITVTLPSAEALSIISLAPGSYTDISVQEIATNALTVCHASRNITIINSAIGALTIASNGSSSSLTLDGTSIGSLAIIGDTDSISLMANASVISTMTSMARGL